MSLAPQFGKIVPSQKQELLNSNYLQWNDKAGDNFADFAQQYLPEIYEQEVERYGNRNVIRILENGRCRNAYDFRSGYLV